MRQHESYDSYWNPHTKRLAVVAGMLLLLAAVFAVVQRAPAAAPPAPKPSVTPPVSSSLPFDEAAAQKATESILHLYVLYGPEPARAVVSDIYGKTGCGAVRSGLATIDPAQEQQVREERRTRAEFIRQLNAEYDLTYVTHAAERDEDGNVVHLVLAWVCV